MMDTLYRQWAVWYIGPQRELLNIEYIGNLEDCVHIVEPRQYGVYAILPYDEEDGTKKDI